MVISERIKFLRMHNEWTQKTLAEYVGESSQVISNWERGYTFPDLQNVIDLANVLDCTTDFLLGRSDQPFDILKKIDNVWKEKGIEETDFFYVHVWEELSKEEIDQILNFFDFIRQSKKTEQTED
ncbi:helix-turn-helix domain-containing protein [Thalassobacillus pellis]|uniref:helix-turn-helix domain-containing protein n=1 Tax=Thalassobacillus pellis TaxID=748008 RepID=UPI001960529C|nr:helix-turn-helix transcriptional regulator [Thalassobacillus pellis]MBM7552663.1 transcriptional regulator with XRE-family HTH domain [Thalassobacillus pellis]